MDKQYIEKRYKNPKIIAAFLEAEWSDLFFTSKCKSYDVDITKCFPSPFYKKVADYINNQVEKKITSVCDVGCATGRFIYEWLRLSKSTKKAYLVEPSNILLKYAKKFLSSAEEVKELYEVGGPIENMISVVENRKLTVNYNCEIVYINKTIEKAAIKDNYFDLITCFNVIDRHQDPPALLNLLKRYVKNNGAVAIASPMDWDSSPAPKKFWVNDLRDYLTEEWTIHSSRDFEYPFRYSTRKVTFFVTQVVICYPKWNK